MFLLLFLEQDPNGEESIGGDKNPGDVFHYWKPPLEELEFMGISDG